MRQYSTFLEFVKRNLVLYFEFIVLKSETTPWVFHPILSKLYEDHHNSSNLEPIAPVDEVHNH